MLDRNRWWRTVAVRVPLQPLVLVLLMHRKQDIGSPAYGRRIGHIRIPQGCQRDDGRSRRPPVSGAGRSGCQQRDCALENQHVNIIIVAQSIRGGLRYFFTDQNSMARVKFQCTDDASQFLIGYIIYNL